MEVKKLIRYNWNLEFHVTEEQKETLKEEAESRIFEMIKEGYVSGELNSYIEEEAQEVWGRWSVDGIIDDEKNNFNESVLEARYYANRLQDIFDEMPFKGHREEDSQKICLLNALGNLMNTINGIEKEDFEN